MHKFLNTLITVSLFLLFSEAAGIVGALFTYHAIPTWYAHLNKPSFSPPNFIFGPVWTALYCLMGLGAFFVFRKGWMLRSTQHKRKEVKVGIGLYVLQLVLNVAWSIIFFGLHMPVLALIEIVVLWFAIAVTMRHFFKISETGAFLLVPYLLWVTFAVLLNCAIVVLN